MGNQVCAVCPHLANCYNANTDEANESMIGCHDDGTVEEYHELNFDIVLAPRMVFAN